MDVVFLHDAEDRLQAAAAWLSGSPQSAAGVAVFVPDARQTERLERLLWEHPPTGFTPHCRFDAALSKETAIVLCSEQPSQWPRATVLNLSDEMPAQLVGVEHLVEIVSQDTATRAAGRVRFRSYQDAGFVVQARKAEKDLRS